VCILQDFVPRCYGVMWREKEPGKTRCTREEDPSPAGLPNRGLHSDFSPPISSAC
ncbi:hypothetical protein NDU88_004412, partial [Pleurodeles waltl]